MLLLATYIAPTVKALPVAVLCAVTVHALAMRFLPRPATERPVSIATIWFLDGVVSIACIIAAYCWWVYQREHAPSDVLVWLPGFATIFYIVFSLVSIAARFMASRVVAGRRVRRDVLIASILVSQAVGTTICWVRTRTPARLGWEQVSEAALFPAPHRYTLINARIEGDFFRRTLGGGDAPQLICKAEPFHDHAELDAFRTPTAWYVRIEQAGPKPNAVDFEIDGSGLLLPSRETLSPTRGFRVAAILSLTKPAWRIEQRGWDCALFTATSPKERRFFDVDLPIISLDKHWNDLTWFPSTVVNLDDGLCVVQFGSNQIVAFDFASQRWALLAKGNCFTIMVAETAKH